MKTVCPECNYQWERKATKILAKCPNCGKNFRTDPSVIAAASAKEAKTRARSEREREAWKKKRRREEEEDPHL